MTTTQQLQQQLMILKHKIKYLKSSILKSEEILESIENNLITALDVVEAHSDDKACEPTYLEAIFRGPAFNKRINLRLYKEPTDEMES